MEIIQVLDNGILVKLDSGKEEFLDNTFPEDIEEKD
jgi:hypothetical protein